MPLVKQMPARQKRGEFPAKKTVKRPIYLCLFIYDYDINCILTFTNDKKFKWRSVINANIIKL